MTSHGPVDGEKFADTILEHSLFADTIYEHSIMSKGYSVRSAIPGAPLLNLYYFITTFSQFILTHKTVFTTHQHSGSIIGITLEHLLFTG